VKLSFHFYALCAIFLISRRFFLAFFTNFSIFGKSFDKRNELCTREREAGKRRRKNMCEEKLDWWRQPVLEEVTAFAVQFDLKLGEGSLQSI
jgi:hypothetical protein